MGATSSSAGEESSPSLTDDDGAPSSSSSSSPSPLSEGEMVGAAIGHNGTVTFKDMYWENVPDSRELTQYLVQAMNAGANKAGLLKKLHPLVCDAGDLIGNTCNVELEVMTSDDTEETASVNPFDATIPQDEVTTEDEAVIDDMSALGGTSGSKPATDPKSDPTSLENALRDEPPIDVTTKADLNLFDTSGDSLEVNSPINSVAAGTDGPNDETANANIDLVDTSVDILNVNSPTSGSVIAGATAVQDPSSQGGSNNDNSSLLSFIIPVVAGAALVALLVAGLLYRRRRKRQVAREDELLRHAHENIRGWNTSLEAVPRKPQLRQDDVVMRSKSLCGGRWTPTVNNHSSTAATAGASVAATSLAAAAGAPATQSIDNILEEFSDSDSSFISDSSIATSDSEQQQHTGSLHSGLAGRVGGGGGSSPSTFDDVGRMGSRLSACGIGSDGGYLPDSLQKAEGSSSSPASPNSLQKQESFEGTHRTISAMHQLHLKKDILHVACDAHDATTSAANTKKDNAAAFEDRGEYGVSRTISPQKNTNMMEKQRLAEEMSLSPSGRYQMRKGNELSTTATWKDVNGKRQEMMKKQRHRAKKTKKQQNRVDCGSETSYPLEVPTGFERSDSVHLVNWSSSGNSISSSGDDSKGAFPSAYV
eukprot:CAMPEP_0201627708 /NCGR_PEP_ID=MMETSP0493-20130528/2833_1 /ASSEMBLY_ACC=CAM_ASM_000838 /TAXON_ID=420259 /ORGANISM="Thalassiosira gravida, Strain GMp14c1" /LENGTH=649 /DNA_ID=CAMNT_0048098249 /DNA_START=1195 /DNA_END=3144 /DNA_ORIENTATION=+